ncbi:MAG: hypothetical protein K0U12_07830, partial [Gammaproteobacteria bacterium]|nr:hypothetical protein [Gammaproteobacteria bacterium]
GGYSVYSLDFINFVIGNLKPTIKKTKGRSSQNQNMLFHDTSHAEEQEFINILKAVQEQQSSGYIAQSQEQKHTVDEAEKARKKAEKKRKKRQRQKANKAKAAAEEVTETKSAAPIEEPTSDDGVVVTSAGKSTPDVTTRSDDDLVVVEITTGAASTSGRHSPLLVNSVFQAPTEDTGKPAATSWAQVASGPGSST